MKKHLHAILLFYKPAIIVSNLFSILILAFGIHPIIILFIKLLITLFIWHTINETKQKGFLIFYNNIGIKPWTLLLGSYIIDSLLLILFLSILIFI